MNLTWHIVKKDLRRMAVPVGVWVVFMVVTTIVWGRFPLYVGSPRSNLMQAELTSAASIWASRMEHFGLILAWFHASMGVLLAATFIQQDPLVCTTSFWSTRPISNGRLLRAKLLGGCILFLAVPAVAMAAVWFSFGFSPGEVARLASEFSCLHAMFIGAAIAAAALTRNLGTFLFAVLGVASWVLIVSVVFRPSGGLPIGRQFTLELLLVVGPLLLLLAQFLAAKRRIGWWLYGAFLALTLLSQFGELPGASHVVRELRALGRPGPPSTPEDQHLSMRLGPATGDERLSIQPVVTGPELPGLVPAVTGLSFTFPTKPYGHHPIWSLGPRWGGLASLRVLGGNISEYPPAWEFSTLVPDVPVNGRERFEMAGVDLSWLEPRVLWTAPISVGTAAGAHEDSTKIVAVRVDNGRAFILCRETDVQYGWGTWPKEGALSQSSRYSQHADCYVVTDSATGQRVVAQRSDSAASALHGVVVTTRILTIPMNISAGNASAWFAQRTLTKVRFFRRHDLHVTFAAGRLDDTLAVSAETLP